MCVCVLNLWAWLFFLFRDLSFTCFAYFYYFVIYSILFYYIHAFLWILCTPLIILDHLYVFRVKHSSFLYPLSIMTKSGRNCDVVSFCKILHVRGRNTFLCRGELCFILLGGVLTSFFMYISLVTMFTYIVHIFDIYIYIFIYDDDDVCLLHLSLHVLFLFFLYTHVSCYLYVIYYFCFTQRFHDEFCLKCFRNTGCQNLLAINSLLANFFKSLC